jgi:hypothetical protein
MRRLRLWPGPGRPWRRGLPAACPLEGEHEGNRDATELENADGNVQVLIEGKLEIPFHVPADRVDSISTCFREDSAERPRGGKTIMGAHSRRPHFPPSGMPQQKQSREKIGMLHRRGERLAAHLEINEQLVGRAHEAGA